MKQISETIDGSIKNVIQLKTLDSSLEWSQMFDALNDCPAEFQNKLVDAINSVAETKDVPATQVFKLVLCGNSDEDVCKKLYNWWRGLFDILSRCKIPEERVGEYNDKVDALMAEITKAGSDLEMNEEPAVVTEDAEELGYEQADKEDEEEMLQNMEFAIQHIGEIANKVKELVNFVNPYCGTEVNESGDQPKFKIGDVVKVQGVSGMDFYGRDAPIGTIVKIEPPHPDVGVYEYMIKGRSGEFFAYEDELELFPERFTEGNDGMDKPARYGIGDHVLYKGEECVVTAVDEDLRNDEEIYQVSRDSDKVPGLSFNDWATWDELEPVEKFTEEDKSTMKNMNERGGDSEWVSMDSLIGAQESDNGEGFWKAADDVDRLEKQGYWSGAFKVGDKVNWIDPETDEITEGWTVIDAPEDDGVEDPDAIYVIANDETGSEAEVMASELRPAKLLGEGNLENELNKGDDGWTEVGQPIGEAGGELDADTFVEQMIQEDPDYDAMYEVYDGGVEDENNVYLNVLAHKETVSYADVEKEFKVIAGEKGWKFNGFKYSSDMVDSIVDDDNCALVVYFKKAAQAVNEAGVVVDASDVWSVLELLDDEKAKKNLTDLINSHVRTEEEIMDAIDSFVEKNWSNGRLSKRELNKTFSNWMSDIVQELGLDVERFNDSGEFVEKGKPTSVELESDGVQKFKVGDEITWRHHNGSLSNEVVRELTDGGYIVDDGFAGEKECYPGHVPEELLGKPNMEWDGKEWKQGIGMAEGTDDQKPEEVKSQDKTFNQDGENKTLVTGEEKKEMSDAEAATIMGGASGTDMDAADMGISSHEVADPYKKPVCEMTIEQEVDNPWNLAEMLWGQGKENLEELLRSGVVDEDYVMQMLEEMELRNLTNINDAFAYDFESILDTFGCDPEAWSQHLKIVKKGDNDDEEEDEQVDEAKKKGAGDPEA